MSKTSLSVIIPTLNEENNLNKLLPYLLNSCQINPTQIIVVDGGSKDNTIQVAKANHVIVISSKTANRGVQMNVGAKKSTAEVLYFLHADAIPPKNFKELVTFQIQKHQIGCFRFLFDSDRLMLKINSWFTRFPFMWCRGGDQSLFVTQNFFKELGGFNETMEVMEDFEIIERAKNQTSFGIIPKNVVVSARKYQNRGWLKVMWANFVAFRLYKNGHASYEIKKRYESLLK